MTLKCVLNDRPNIFHILEANKHSKNTWIIDSGCLHTVQILGSPPGFLNGSLCKKRFHKK
jgi:hypothetical protein